MTREHFWQLHVKQKSIRSFLTPTLDAAQRRQRIKRRIDFDHVEMLRIPAQSLFRAQLFWIPILHKPRISPTRGADANFTHVSLSYRKPIQTRQSNARSIATSSKTNHRSLITNYQL